MFQFDASPRIPDLRCIALVSLALWTCSATFAQDFTILATFGPADGGRPSPLAQGADGNFWGTTFLDGAVNNGTVFKVGADGTLKALYNFCSKTDGSTLYCLDGMLVEAGLLQASDGNLYGTTTMGGTYNGGTIFRVTPDGGFSTIYNFCALTNCPDGFKPAAALVEGSDGNLYGTTSYSGANGSGGTVFRVTADGTLATLHTFCEESNCSDTPAQGALVEGSDGNFYGTTVTGGFEGIGGTVFRITPQGVLTTLHSFCTDATCAEGDYPMGALVQGTDGSFYGTTSTNGATSGGYGTVFRITGDGVFTTLHSFCSEKYCSDGYGPHGGLLQATDGNLYGTTSLGGANGGGTLFRITNAGTFTTLYNFCITAQPNCPDGYGAASVIQGTDGNLYGAAPNGGDEGGGTAFRFSVGLAPFIKTQPSARPEGSEVLILGNNLTSAREVTFSGVPASFRVISNSAIKATVPLGAATGAVEVETSSATLESNGPFRVVASSHSSLKNVGSAADGFIATIAPNSIAAAYGNNLAVGTESVTTLPLPTKVQGTTLELVDSTGKRELAPLFFVSGGSPDQVNFLVPADLASGTAAVTVTAQDGTMSQGTTTIAPVSPGVFQLNASGLAAAIVFDATTNTYSNVYQVSRGKVIPLPISLPASDHVFLELFATGLRSAGKADVSATVGTTTVSVIYAGAQGNYEGLDQVNVALPASLAGSGDVSVKVTANGIAANPVHITIR